MDSGRSSVSLMELRIGAGPDLRISPVQASSSSSSAAGSDSSELLSRIRQLNWSERRLLRQLCPLPSMHHSQRLDQKLYSLREDVRTMSREKEQVEKVWRERLQRCQAQLEAKEDELLRQTQHFESFRSQLQNQLRQSREAEEALQNRIYTLEKQLLDMTVTAATGLASTGPVRITAGPGSHWEEQDCLPSLRGEGEGEEERKEERKKRWPRTVGDESDENHKDSDQSRLRGFILSLQEDLRVLLEREEKAMTEHRALAEQLHEAQESGHLLGCKVEEMKSEINQLSLAKASLQEELEELREENQRLQHCLRDTAEHLPNNTHVCVQKLHISDDEKPSLPTTKSSSNTSTSAKPETSHSATNGPQSSLQPLTLTTETIDELRMGTWCYNGLLNLEDSPGEDSDALREAYRSLGLGDNLDFIKAQRDRFEEALLVAQEQLKTATLENAKLKSQIKHQLDETSLEEEEDLSGITNLDDSARFSVGSDDLVQALNEENRALAAKIQQLRDHIEMSEEEMVKERSEVKEQICRLEIDGARQQQEINEQAALVSELTRKTEDDLNIIMELQQKIAEHEELREETRRKKLFGFQSKHTQTVFRKDNIDECVDIVVNCVIESDKEPQYTSSKQQNKVTQINGKSSEHVDSMNEEVDQLTKLVQSLRAEQDDLMGRVKTQRLQQKEVAQSIRAQTEEKQRLTREVWALKEEKDNVSKFLSELKQERDAQTRAVCGVKDEREQFQRSMAALRQEKEQLYQALPNLKKERDAILEAISSGRWERDQLAKSTRNLQSESQQLSQAVSGLKREKDELSNQLRSLEERRDQERLCDSLQEESSRLQKSVDGLKEEERRMTFSVSRLKQEESQMSLLVQGLQEEHSRLQAMSPRRTQTSDVDTTYSTNANTWGEDDGEQCENNVEDPNIQIETLSEELQKSQDELEQIKAEKQRLQSELFQSEVRRDEAERRASHFADSLFKVTDESNQLQETRRECDSLRAQVKDQQNKVTVLGREKSEALTLKARTEEQHKVLAAQLKAKTVALEELNTEYIRLKHNQGTKEDLETALVSLQSRYSDVRTKYDTLLHRKSQADMDIAPLKAKLSCLVVKCQERNNALVQTTKLLQRHGCVDYVLKQQVERLLNDAALHSYASAFTSGPAPGLAPEITVTYENSDRLDQPGSVSPRLPLRPDLSSVSPRLPLRPEPSPRSLVCVEERSSPLSVTSSRNTSRHCFSKFSYESSPTVKNVSPKCISPVHELREEHGSTAVWYNTSHSTQLLLSPKDHKRIFNGSSPSFEKTDKKVSSPNSPSLLPKQSEVRGSKSPAAAQKQPKQEHRLSPSSSALKSTVKAKSTPDLTRFSSGPGPGPGPGSSSSLSGFSSSRRLSSPEKIMSLQEQLQKTLLSTFQSPLGKGSSQPPRKCLSFSAQSLTSSQTSNPNLSVYTSTAKPPKPASLQTSAPEPAASNRLFNAVVARSAAVTFSPVAQTFPRKKSTSGVSRASSNVSALSSSSAAQSKASPTSGPATSPKLQHKSDDNLPIDAQRGATVHSKGHFLSVSPASTDCNGSKSSGSPESGPSRSSSFNNTASQKDRGGSFVSPQLTLMCAKRPPSSAEKSRTPTRLREETPAEVRSVEVIKAVGGTGLLIGWERPPLDELGCSNGTFVYGYRVFVDGVFHKSVMSSACTKCILENIPLDVPMKISVQTLGSNGLSSNCVHTVFSQNNHSPDL